MNTSFYIAKRYLFSKKSVNAINFISGISMLGVFVGSAALVIILSVFNGFETLVLSMYNTFTPELRIEPARGKTFLPDKPYFNQLVHDGRVANYTEVLQEKALIRYGKSQYIGLVKGVSNDFAKSKNLDSAMIQGKFTLTDQSGGFAVIGSVVQAYLSVNLHDDLPLEIYSPKKGNTSASNPADEFNLKKIYPSGVFQVQQQFDDMVIVPISFERQLLDEDKQVSAIEINLRKGLSADDLQDEIEQKLGSTFLVKSRIQQNQLLYKVLNSEKWAIFLILTFVLIIAIFNIIGSLTMLVIDKRKDIAILSSIGADSDLIRKIFFIEGMLISVTGCVTGMAAGLAFSLLQQRYGFIKMGQVDMVVDAYPVSLKALDFVLVFVTVILISVVASAISSRLSVKHITEMNSDL